MESTATFRVLEASPVRMRRWIRLDSER